MSAKPSLYELLGVDPQATQEELRAAYEVRSQALAAEADCEQRAHRLLFLRQAYEVLADPRRRARYDARPPRVHPEPQAPIHWSRRRRAWAAFSLGAIVAVASAMTKITQPDDVAAQPPETTAPVVVETVGERRLTLPPPPQTLSAETVAKAGEPSAPAAALAPSAPPLPALPRNVPFEVVGEENSSVVDAVIGSTYLIIGNAGLGTAVAIERERLLTNCHVIAPNVLKGPIFAVNALTGEATQIRAAAFLIKEDACVASAPGLNGRPLVFGNTSRLSRGTRIYNLGFAKGRLTFSQGAFMRSIQRSGQTYLASSNFCDAGVSGGPLVDEAGNLVGLTAGSTVDLSVCLSITAETARQVLTQVPVVIDAFPRDYMTNLKRNW